MKSFMVFGVLDEYQFFIWIVLFGKVEKKLELQLWVVKDRIFQNEFVCLILRLDLELRIGIVIYLSCS